MNNGRAAEPRVLMHRGWGIRVWNQYDRFEEVVRRAADEAANYGMNLLDLHDGVIPPGIGWVELFAQYRHVLALRDKESLTYKGIEVRESERAHYREKFQDLCRYVKSRDLRIHVWYHVLRDLPEEWLAAEPAISRLEGRRLWQVIGSMLEDLFTAVPEIDAVVVTAGQTASTPTRDQSSVTPGERLRAIYQCVYEACRRHRRQFIIRETGDTPAECDTFLYAVGPLPPEIQIMLKSVQKDWCHLSAPINPIIQRLSGKTVLLETDLYGEHWGQTALPLCRPAETYQLVRSWLPLKIAGAVGRIMVQENEQGVAASIFDSPNTVNLDVLGKLLASPGLTFQEAGQWSPDLEETDRSLWYSWTKQFGTGEVSPYLVSALERTPLICQYTLYLAGAYFQHRSFLPEPEVFESSLWPTFLRKSENVDSSLLLWEKDEAARLIQQSLDDLQRAAPTMHPQAVEMFTQYFEQAKDIAEAFRALIELCISRVRPETLRAACRDANDLATRVEILRGGDFYGRLPDRLRELSEYMQEAPPLAEISATASPQEARE